MPRRRTSLVEDLILCPWWVSVVLAAAAWIGLRLILPDVQSDNLALKIVTPALIQWAPFITLGLLVLAALSALRSLSSRRTLDAQTSLQSLRQLPWKTFEDIIAEAYRRQGYKVEEMLGGGADGGIDLRLGKDGKRTLVQCKRWRNKPVPVETVRELFGVMVHEKAAAAKIVATTNFTADAISFAKGKPIELIDSDDLLRLVRDVQSEPRVKSIGEQREHLTPACPSCGATMVLREARRGKNAGSRFWGCPTYPRCRATRPF